MEKAQGALEYLLLIGAAALLIVIVIVVISGAEESAEDEIDDTFDAFKDAVPTGLIKLDFAEQGFAPQEKTVNAGARRT